MKKVLFILLFICILSVFTVSVYATERTVYIPAVRETEYGYEGVLASLTVRVEKGFGHVYVDTYPLTQVDTQGSARLVKEVVGDMLGIDMDDYDLYFVIRSDAPIIGGPSAGAAMATATLAAFLNLSLDSHAVVTGTINPDGSVGPVGGLFEKAQAVARANGTRFLIPEGQSIIIMRKTERTELGGLVQIITKPVKLDLKKYARENWGLEVIEVYSIKDILKYTTGYRFKEKEAVISEDPQLKRVMKTMAEKSLNRTQEMISETQNILNSAKMSYNYVQELNRILNEQKQAFATAKQTYEQRDYYAASSKSFTASIQVSYVRNLAFLIDARNSENFLENLISEIENNITDISNEVNTSREDIDNIIDIEIISAAEERINNAKDALKQAWKNFYNGNYIDSVYYASFAQERTHTAELWLDLVHSFEGEGLSFSFDQLKPLAERRIEDALSSIIYAKTLGLNTDKAEEHLDRANRDYDQGVYSSAIFNAVMSRAQANMVMEMRDADNNTLQSRAQSYNQRALEAIQESQGKGAEPILAISYYEYANSFEDDIANRLLYLKYSKEFAEVSKDFLEILEGKQFKETVKPEDLLEPVPLEQESGEYVILAFVGGLLLGLLFEDIAKPKRRKSRG
jgi:uncharacterized protein